MKNFNIKNYWKPTPKKWRKIGDAILLVGMTITGGVLMQFELMKEIYTTKEIKIIMSSAMVLGLLGKFLTNFFKKDDKPTPKNDDKL